MVDEDFKIKRVRGNFLYLDRLGHCFISFVERVDFLRVDFG